MNVVGLLGISEYGSDSEEENLAPEVPIAGPSNAKPAPTSSLLSSLPPPKNRKSDGPKKILIPKLRPADEDRDGEESERPAKKQKTDDAAAAPPSGRSSLLGMLPAPKKSSLALPPPKRAAINKPEMLGSSHKTKETIYAIGHKPNLAVELTGSEEDAEEKSNAPTLSTEQSEKMGVEEVAGLGDAWMNPRNKAPAELEAVKATQEKRQAEIDLQPISLPAVIAAPELENWENWVPPEPKPDDPYPGFYKHPSGSWEQYDREYYMQFYNRWAGYETGTDPFVPSSKDKGFAEYKEENGVEANARKVWQEAEVERQKRNAQREAKKLEEEARKKAEEEGRAQPAYQAPKSKTSRIANTRHQLAGEIQRAMLMQAQIEENLSSGKQARKESRRKYGF